MALIDRALEWLLTWPGSTVLLVGIFLIGLAGLARGAERHNRW